MDLQRFQTSNDKFNIQNIYVITIYKEVYQLKSDLYSPGSLHVQSGTAKISTLEISNCKKLLHVQQHCSLWL